MAGRVLEAVVDCDDLVEAEHEQDGSEHQPPALHLVARRPQPADQDREQRDGEDQRALERRPERLLGVDVEDRHPVAVVVARVQEDVLDPERGRHEQDPDQDRAELDALEHLGGDLVDREPRDVLLERDSTGRRDTASAPSSERRTAPRPPSRGSGAHVRRRGGGIVERAAGEPEHDRGAEHRLHPRLAPEDLHRVQERHRRDQRAGQVDASTRRRGSRATSGCPRSCSRPSASSAQAASRQVPSRRVRSTS